MTGALQPEVPQEGDVAAQSPEQCIALALQLLRVPAGSEDGLQAVDG
jgi:hypothetical protein